MNERTNVREAIIGDRNRRNSIEKKQIERERQGGRFRSILDHRGGSLGLEECWKERGRRRVFLQ